MERLSANQTLAVAVVGRLRACGVRTFCVCPGGRNAPLVEVLDEQVEKGSDSFSDPCPEVLSFFDERSAAFFALGRARRDGTPVAVVTTSGTAAAELLPAMVEAHYSGVPLLAVTADRPRAYRGSGAPQAIDQVNIFGTFARVFVDLEHPGDAWTWPAPDGPAHINVCFSDPLLADWRSTTGVPLCPDAVPPDPGTVLSARDAAAIHAFAIAEFESFLARVRSPLIIVGGLHQSGDREPVARFCQELGAPMLAEASSGIRSAPGARLLRSGDEVVQRGIEQHLFDSVIRIGEVPSFRIWRDLELSFRVPVLSVSRTPWRGLTHGTHLHVPAGMPLPLPADARRTISGAARLDGAPAPTMASIEALLAWDARVAAASDRLLASHPRSEPALVRRLSETIPAGSFVYLGNSLPIREWNQFATFADRRLSIGENRGANGIDGQVASFLGWARPGVENWAVIGDLTALYDLSAPWALRHLDGLRLRIVVINNGGGRIFKRMFRNERFQNRHAAGFEAWAAMWGTEYHAALPSGEIGPAAIIELRPDEDETEAFWARLADEARG